MFDERRAAAATNHPAASESTGGNNQQSNLEGAQSLSLPIVVYWSSVSGSLIIKRQQQHIFDTLDIHRISYRRADLAAPENVSAKEMLRAHNEDNLIVLPQIWVAGRYRMDYEAFENALEGGYLVEELNRQPTPGASDLNQIGHSQSSFISR